MGLCTCTSRTCCHNRSKCWQAKNGFFHCNSREYGILLASCWSICNDPDAVCCILTVTVAIWSFLKLTNILASLLNEGNRSRDAQSGSQQQHPHARSFTAMRRWVKWPTTKVLLTSYSLAYDLGQLVSQRPDSVLNPTSTRLTSRNELEYLDVFDFFNYPRTRPPSQQGSFSTVNIANTLPDVVRFDQFQDQVGGDRNNLWHDMSRNGSWILSRSFDLVSRSLGSLFTMSQHCQELEYRFLSCTKLYPKTITDKQLRVLWLEVMACHHGTVCFDTILLDLSRHDTSSSWSEWSRQYGVDRDTFSCPRFQSASHCWLKFDQTHLYDE